MTDTPEHLKDYQLKLWLSKSPAERLRQMMLDNDALFHFWKNTIKTDSKQSIDPIDQSKPGLTSNDSQK